MRSQVPTGFEGMVQVSVGLDLADDLEAVNAALDDFDALLQEERARGPREYCPRCWHWVPRAAHRCWSCSNLLQAHIP